MEQVAKCVEVKSKAEGACHEMLRWFGEDAKAQPEELFSALANFVVTLEKGHRCDLD